MRIGIDASRAFSDQPTGTENYSTQLITHLLSLPQAQDHTWVLYAKKDLSKHVAPRVNVEVKVINLPWLWTQVGLASRTWIDKLDVLWVPAHTLPVIRPPGLRTVVTIHGIEYEFLPAYENKLQRWYLPLSTWYATHSATRLIAVSEFTRGQLVQRLQGNPAKIEVVYEGVDASTKEFSRSEVLQTLSRLGITSKKYLLFIGTVQPRKNLARLIKVYKALSISQKLVIVGKLGWGYADLPLEGDDQILFLRYLSNTERDIVLRNALVYIQPSITEGFGLPVLEAFANQVPVVSSNGGALREVASLARVDNLFDPLNESQMAEKISRAVADSAWRKTAIAAGKEKLLLFSWQKAAELTYNILTRS